MVTTDFKFDILHLDSFHAVLKTRTTFETPIDRGIRTKGIVRCCERGTQPGDHSQVSAHRNSLSRSFRLSRIAFSPRRSKPATLAAVRFINLAVSVRDWSSM